MLLLFVAFALFAQRFCLRFFKAPEHYRHYAESQSVRYGSMSKLKKKIRNTGAQEKE